MVTHESFFLQTAVAVVQIMLSADTVRASQRHDKESGVDF